MIEDWCLVVRGGAGERVAGYRLKVVRGFQLSAFGLRLAAHGSELKAHNVEC
jgi:hypothetical protein